MSLGPRTRRIALAVTLGLTLSLAACGGGGGSDEASPATSDGATTTTVVPDLGDLPTLDAGPHEFAELDGSKARFINLLVNEGEGVDMDVYWGVDAETGKKATAVGYGEVTDWMPIEIDQDPIFTRTDGVDEVSVAFYPEGETAFDQQIMQKAETIDGDVLYTFTMGTSGSPSPGVIPASLGLGYDHRAGEAPEGQAWVALNTSGVGGIEGGDFMTLNSGDGCGNLTAGDVGDTANSGQAYIVEPGTTEFTASDANTECATKTDPISVDLEAGEGYVLFAYGTTLEDRQLLAVQIGE